MEIERTDRFNNLATLSRAIDANAQAQPLTPLGRPTTTLEMVTAQRVVVPRDSGEIMQRLKALASMAGSEYYYSFPVKKKNKETGEWEQDFIQGPSIKLANDLVREYGNCGVETMVVDVGDSWVIYARFVDLERGFTMVRPFQQRKAQTSVGTKDVARQMDIALQIGVSKAIRNVIVNSLETYADFMFEEAKSGLLNWITKEPEKYRTRIVNKLADLKVDLKRVERQIGRASKDWQARDLARLFSELKAVNDGMITIAELWPTQEFIGPDDAKPTEDSAGGSTGGADASASGDAKPPEATAETAKDAGPVDAGPRDPAAGDGKAKAAAKPRVDRRAAEKPKDDPALPLHQSQALQNALSELMKMTTAETVGILTEMAEGVLTADDFALFKAAADERLQKFA